MANPFSINVITSSGVALIAQATAANQIVITGALSGTEAATDAADLASKTEAFYDGISGSIVACSATDNLAHIIARFGNAGANAQVVKSVAIKGRLASQSDAQAVIVAAMSDENSEIYIPSSSSPHQITRIKTQFAVQADATVQSTFADGATMADLERFVSLYKAGDPSTGEDQIIQGEKSFVGNTSFHDSISVTNDAYVYGLCEADGGLQVGSDVDNPANLTVYGDIITTSIKTTDNGDDDLTIECGDLKTSGITLSGSLDVADDSTFRGYVEVFGELNVSKVVGLAPIYVSNTITLPVGGIALGRITTNADMHCGDLISSTIYSATYDYNTNSYASSTIPLPNGTYRLLHGVTYQSPISVYPCLVQRVS